MDRVKVLSEISHKEKSGIFVVTVPTVISASKTVRKILDNYSDLKTALFLSGGKTPKKLYEDIASEKTLKVGAALMVDERFGEKLHKKSNELMIKQSGLIEYFENQNIRFYPILLEVDVEKNSMYHKLVYDTMQASSYSSSSSIEQTSRDYDETLRFLFKFFPKTVGLLGIGTDGHTAGLPAGAKSGKLKTKSLGFEVAKRILEDQSSLVTFYVDEDGKYGARITMTFLALSQLDLIILLVLGQEKREALRLMFAPSASVRQAQDKSSGQAAIEEVPARFYLKPEIAQKVILVTDQIV